MSDEPRPCGETTDEGRRVLSISAVGAVTPIDAGNTLALSVTSPEDTETVLVLPVGVARAMVRQVAAGLDHARQERRRWTDSN